MPLSIQSRTLERGSTPEEQERSYRQRLRKGWRRLRILFKAPRRIRPTRAGVAFLFLTLSVGFAALNTGNNLLYLVLGMMLSLIGISGILSEISVRRLSVSRRLPHETTVGSPTPVTLELFNHKRSAPGIGIWVSEYDAGQIEADPTYFVHVPASSTCSLRSRMVFQHRGRQVLRRLTISTTYPFGLFRRSYERDAEDAILVYPQVERVLPGHSFSDSARGDTSLSRKGQGDEFFGLRPYAAGDDPRHIHWKSSARRAKLLQREYAVQQRQRLVVKLELVHPLPEDSTYEKALVRTVSFAAYYLERGYQVAIDLPGGAVPFEAGTLQLKRVLRAAALAPRAGEAAELPPSSVRWASTRMIVVRVAGTSVSVGEGA